MANAKVPEGYTYSRCDRYTREEFLSRFTYKRGKKTEILPEALEYVDTHPKPEYTTDDEIAILSCRSTIAVHGIPTVYGGYSTKGYMLYDEETDG